MRDRQQGIFVMAKMTWGLVAWGLTWWVSVAQGVEPMASTGKVTWLSLDATGRFRMAGNDPALPLVVDGTSFCQPAGGDLTPQTCAHPQLGAGKQVELQDAAGHRLRFSRFANLSFTLVEGAFCNSTEQETNEPALTVASLPLDLGVPASELRVLGTGGLSETGTAPGSYMWISVAHPATRRGAVVGWLTGHRGSGVLVPRVVDERVVIDARLEFGRLRLAAGQAETLDTLVVGTFDDVRLGLEAYADAVARVHGVRLKTAPCGYCTWYHAGASSAQRMEKLAAFAERDLKPFGLEFLQIDDGWQAGETKNGPRKNFTEHRAKGPYPDGMQPTAAAISARGLTPGLWLMPFAGTWDDPFFAERQAWFAKREDGTPFDTNWGGTCLDLTRPEVQAYVRENVARIVREWGYRYLKMDGLFTGAACEIQYINDTYKDDHLGNAKLANPDKTHVEALRDGLRIVREAAGDEVFLLGCCAPQNMRSYGGAFGLVDAMRIGPDNGANVEELLVGPRFGSRNYFLNGRLWWNDPDPIYVRGSLSLAQAELSCTWAAVAGQLTVASDELERLPQDRLEILKRVLPTHNGWARPVDGLDRDLPQVWVAGRQGQAEPALVGLYNWEQVPIEIDEPLARLGLDPQVEYLGYEFWSDRWVPSIRERLAWRLEPVGDKEFAAAERRGEAVRRCCAAVALRPLRPHPQVVSTSRHVTQGMVDLVHEAWDGEKRELVGVSRVVGGDAYELRIATHSNAGTWRVREVQVRAEDAVAGVTIEEGPRGTRAAKPAAGLSTISGEGSGVGADNNDDAVAGPSSTAPARRPDEPGLVRITMRAPTSREVRWTVVFSNAGE